MGRLSSGLRIIRRRVAASMPRPLDYAAFLQEWRGFTAAARRAGDTRFALSSFDLLPYLDDRTATTAIDRHYLYHPAWAARKLAALRPAEHVDVGSSLGFSAQMSAFVPMRFYDYRPADVKLAGLTSGRADLLALPFADRSIASLSCMHTVEHVGLGRYGDPIDPQGDLRAMSELARVLAPGGNLLFVVPVGKPKVAFNAHRIYSHAQVVEAFAALELREFTLVPDDGPMIEHADPALVNEQTWGCGCFWFARPAAG